jgi:hypothetical protein
MKNGKLPGYLTLPFCTGIGPTLDEIALAFFYKRHLNNKSASLRFHLIGKFHRDDLGQEGDFFKLINSIRLTKSFNSMYKFLEEKSEIETVGQIKSIEHIDDSKIMITCQIKFVGIDHPPQKALIEYSWYDKRGRVHLL